jgi:tRNA(Ser,Leu) C12 N-acetylase TAN1
MTKWNVIITIQEHYFEQVWQCLKPFGVLAKTDFYNVLVMQTEDTQQTLQQLQKKLNADADLQTAISRVLPVTHSFTFQSPEEFETKARAIAETILSEVANKSFHVRMHRRGFKGRLSSIEEEKFLDTYIQEQLEQSGSPCEISFDNPDIIIAVETVAQQAGISIWSREDIERYPILKLD